MPFIAIRLLALLWAVIVLPPALLVLIIGATWMGRLFCVAAILTAILPLLGVAAWQARSWRKWLGIALAGWAAAAAVVNVTLDRLEFPRHELIQALVARLRSLTWC